jgi:hypothetical protein
MINAASPGLRPVDITTLYNLIYFYFITKEEKKTGRTDQNWYAYC